MLFGGGQEKRVDTQVEVANVPTGYRVPVLLLISCFDK